MAFIYLGTQSLRATGHITIHEHMIHAVENVQPNYWKITSSHLQEKNSEQVTDNWQSRSCTIYFMQLFLLLLDQCAGFKYLQVKYSMFLKGTVKRTRNPCKVNLPYGVTGAMQQLIWGPPKLSFFLNTKWTEDTHQMTAHFCSKQQLQPQCPNTSHTGQATGCSQVLSSSHHSPGFSEKNLSHSGKEIIFLKHTDWHHKVFPY